MNAGPFAGGDAMAMDRKLDEALVSALELPQVLGERFVVRRILAVGQTMVLGIADDLMLALPTMIKILRPGYRKRGFKHLREEARASDRVRHIDRGTSKDPVRLPFLAGDALVGQSLAQLVSAQGEMPPDVMSMIEEALGALSAELLQAGFRAGPPNPQRIIVDMYHGAVLLRANFRLLRPT